MTPGLTTLTRWQTFLYKWVQLPLNCRVRKLKRKAVYRPAALRGRRA